MADPFIWDKTITIVIKSGATLTINADLDIKNNFSITIEEGVQFIIDGNVSIKNIVDGLIDGSLYITGKLVYLNSVSESFNSITLNLPNGYYVANIILNDRVETFKVYLN